MFNIIYDFKRKWHLANLISPEDNLYNNYRKQDYDTYKTFFYMPQLTFFLLVTTALLLSLQLTWIVHFQETLNKCSLTHINVHINKDSHEGSKLEFVNH
jgi:uncharacterized membrane protein YesL